ncbi:MAG: hypothetical protein ACOC1G_05760, partial [Phycisphaeraceae bacterium]
MLELRVIEGPGRGRPLATHGESLVVQRTAEDVDHTRPRSGGWVVRPFVGGQRVLVNGEPANGRTSLRVGDRISVGANVYEVRDATPPAATESAPTAPEGERLFALRYDRQALPAPARNTRKATLLPDRATVWLDGMKGSAKSLIKPGTSSPSDGVVLPLPRPLPPSASDAEPELELELESAGTATVDTDDPARFPSTPQRKAIAALLIAGISLGIGAIALVLTQSAPVNGTAASGEDTATATTTTASPSRTTPAGETRVAAGSDRLGTSLFENDEPPVSRNTLAFAAGSQRTASDDPFAAGPEAQSPQPEPRPGTQAHTAAEDRLASSRSASRSSAANTTTPRPASPAAIPTPTDASEASEAGEDDASSDAARDALAPAEREVPVENAAGDSETSHADAAPATAAAAASDARTTFFLLDASGSMVDRLPQALDTLRERVKGLDPNDRFLVVLFNGHGLSFVPARGTTPATERARAEALAFLRVDRIDAFGRGDRMQAILFAIAHAEPRDKIVLMTDPSHFAGDPKSLYDRVARI